jgi:branched-chain amino acid transport system substrate-binding protein
MISPTTSTNELRGLDDHFFRVMPCSAQTSKELAGYLYDSMGLRSVAVVYDTQNRAHTESAFVSFREEFESRGGKIVSVETFLSGPDVSFSDIAGDITEEQADCLYILANAMDTAILCQQLCKQGKRMQVVGSDWSMTSDIVEFGGKSVEGLFAMHTVDRSSEEPSYQRFKEAFVERFGRDPDFASVHAYDSARVLLKALERNTDPSRLRKTIREIGAFEGLQTEISFDEFGDVIREHHPIEIVDGHFVRVE